jgi:predicted nucleic acid-binding protein
VRTLDALHLATADYLRSRGFVVDIATHDARMRQASVAMGFGLAAL